MQQGILRLVTDALQQVEESAALAGDNQSVQALLDAAGDNLRRVMRDLRQQFSPLGGVMLDERDLRDGLLQLVEYARRSEGAPLEAYIDESINGVLSQIKVGHLLQITKEALANAIAHAGASAMALRVGVEGNLLVLRLSDDGRGFDLAKARENREGGLARMQRRADAIGGVLSVVSDPQAGTIVTLTLPNCCCSSPEHYVSPNRGD